MHHPDSHTHCGENPPNHYGRKFVPDAEYSKESDFKDNLHDCGDCTFIPCPNNLKEYHTGHITVAIKCTYRDNGSTKALTAYGIYFARQSPFNEGMLTGDFIASGDRAVLVACIETLDTVTGLTYRLKKGHIIEGLTKLHRVIIKHTSDYLIITIERIEKWNTKGWPTSISDPVPNLEFFQAIDQKIKALDDLGVHVAFWHVSWAQNKDAYNLSRKALQVPEVDELFKQQSQTMDHILPQSNTNRDWPQDYHRKFVPEDEGYKGTDLNKELKDRGKGQNLIHLPDLSSTFTHNNQAIVVAVNGACSGSGLDSAKSAFGVYFARKSKYNYAQKVPGSVHTIERALLHAFIAAIVSVSSLASLSNRWPEAVKGLECALQRLVIKTDSSYLASTIADRIDNWKTNGYKQLKGQSVENADMFKISREIRDLEKRGVYVSFWPVPQENNQEADGLAHDALDGKRTPRKS
ncbi:MAG: hypothetical protein Q9202_006968 [Teloschistes flavicans]